MTSITPGQIRAIHAVSRGLGLDNDERRDRIEAVTGIRSSKDLTRSQAAAVLADLGKLERASRPRPPRRPGPPRLPRGVARMATAAQRRLIDALVSEVEWRSADGYRRWLRRSLGIGRVASAAQAARVIEGLKGLKGR